MSESFSKSQLKTWLRRHGFKPACKSNWRNVLQAGIVSRSGRLYRFRTNQYEYEDYGLKRWTVDVSCPIPEFDRWANSQDEHAVELPLFMARFPN